MEKQTNTETYPVELTEQQIDMVAGGASSQANANTNNGKISMSSSESSFDHAETVNVKFHHPIV